MKQIFVSGPLRAGDPEKPVGVTAEMMNLEVDAILAAITDAGASVVAPHLRNVHLQATGDEVAWQLSDLDVLSSSDALFLTGNPTGHVALAEIAKANSLGIPVFTELAPLLAWIAAP